jgi:hypothetical protein
MDIARKTVLRWENEKEGYTLISHKMRGFEWEKVGRRIKTIRIKAFSGVFEEAGVNFEDYQAVFGEDDPNLRGEKINELLGIEKTALFGQNLHLTPEYIEEYYGAYRKMIDGWEGILADGKDFPFTDENAEVLLVTLDFDSEIKPFVDYVVDESDVSKEQRDFLADGSKAGSFNPKSPAVESAKKA